MSNDASTNGGAVLALFGLALLARGRRSKKRAS